MAIYLEDYKDLISTFATIATICQFLTGSKICRDFMRKGHTGDVSGLPLVVGALNRWNFLSILSQHIGPLELWPSNIWNNPMIWTIKKILPLLLLSMSGCSFLIAASTLSASFSTHHYHLLYRYPYSNMCFLYFSSCWFRYSLLIDDTALKIVNGTGAFLNTIWCVTYYIYTQRKFLIQVQVRNRNHECLIG